jgi:hypothetical protein
VCLARQKGRQESEVRAGTVKKQLRTECRNKKSLHFSAACEATPFHNKFKLTHYANASIIAL